MDATRVEQPPQTGVQFSPAELLRPAAFPHPITDLRLRETHLAWIILTGAYAYKIKKGVTLSFVDQSTLAQRKALCDEELRLNLRLASDLYEGVVTVTSDADGLRVDGQGSIVEYAVKMKQFDASQELSALLECGSVAAAEIRDLGTRLADFHQGAAPARVTGQFEATRQLHDAVMGNIATLLCHLDGDIRLPKLGLLVDWTHDFLHKATFWLQQREFAAHVRECHGDLHARNIVRWHGHLMPFDCLEFEPTLRWIDAMNDVAFLFMDLISHGRKDLAFDFLNAYLARGGDYDGVRLLRFYAIYRALVRATVDVLTAESDSRFSDEYKKRAVVRLQTAANLLEQRGPALIIMHGLSGSGKSQVSAHLAECLGAVQVRSDLERRRLAGASSVPVHTPEFNLRTYAHLLACAEACIQGGTAVIVDATFLDRINRDHFRQRALLHGVPFVIVSCTADLAVLQARIQRRQQSGVDASDADALELQRQVKCWAAPGDAERPFIVEADTMREGGISHALTLVGAMMQAGVKKAVTKESRI